MSGLQKRKPRGLGSLGAAFKKNDYRRNSNESGFIKQSRTERRQKRGWKRGQS